MNQKLTFLTTLNIVLNLSRRKIFKLTLQLNKTWQKKKKKTYVVNYKSNITQKPYQVNCGKEMSLLSLSVEF